LITEGFDTANSNGIQGVELSLNVLIKILRMHRKSTKKNDGA